jgi:hypothetical protein
MHRINCLLIARLLTLSALYGRKNHEELGDGIHLCCSLQKYTAITLFSQLTGRSYLWSLLPYCFE